jgi:hypothetical protein
VGESGTIIHTDNAGENWETVSIGSTNLFLDVYFINPDDGWIVGKYGKIWNTSDGGNTWEAQESNTNLDLNCVYFTDQNIGWIAGDDGLILYTENGGSNWIMSYSGTTKDLSMITFFDPNHGWAIGEEGTILFTSNEGGIITPVHNFDATDDLLTITAYPNPFDAQLRVTYTLEDNMYVSLSVYSMNGNKITSLNKLHLKGKHTINVDSRMLSPGIYLITLKTALGLHSLKAIKL